MATKKTNTKRKQRNSVQVSDIPTELHEKIKVAAKKNLRTMGNELISIAAEKFKVKL